MTSIAFIESIDNIIKIDNQPEYKKIVYFHQKYLMTNTGIKLEARKFWYTRTLETASEIQEQDPLFEIPYIEEPAEKGGCYIATAVYGSYDCPQVWTLRHYRDYKLSKTFLGRVFIRTYYVISPILVKWFGNSAWFKNLWKRKLDGVIASLQNKGVESKSCDDFLDVNL